MTQWIYTSSLLIVAVLLIRAFGRDRLSARLRYALWGLVLLRLLMPFSIGESVLSVRNWLPETIPQPVMNGHRVHADAGETMGVPHGPVMETMDETTDMTQLSETSQTTQTTETTQTAQMTETPGAVQTQTTPATQSVNLPLFVWCVGMAAVGSVFLVSNVRFWLRLRRRRRFVMTESVPVYESAAVETPCLFGFPRAAIYVTPAVWADETALRHVLAHELTHHRHKDHVWSLLRCVCVTLHWYNPLVWVAAIASQKDAELACDEGTLAQLGAQERTSYAKTLLNLTCVGYKGVLTTATSMTGSESDLKTRVLRIVKNPKMSAIALVVVLAIAILAALAVFTGEKKDPLEGVWVMDYEEVYPHPDFKRQGRAILEYEDGVVREEHYYDGEHSHTYEYVYRIEGDVVRYELTYADRMAYQYRYERSDGKLTLYRENGLPYGTYTPYERPDNVFCTDKIEHVTRVEMYRAGVAAECVSSSSSFIGNRILGLLQYCEILDTYPAPEHVAAEHVYRITIEAEGVTKELVYGDGILYMNGTAYVTDAAEDLNALFLGTMWQPVGGYVDENGEAYTHVPTSDGALYLWLDMISGYGDSRVYIPANQEEWIAAVEEMAEHRVVAESEADVDRSRFESLSVGGTDRWQSITIYSNGDIFFWENLGDGVSVNYYVSGENAPKLMALASPYLEIVERSRKASAGDVSCDGLWIMPHPVGDVKYIRMSLDGDAKYAALSASGGRSCAQVGEQLIEARFDFYVRDGLFHVRWNDLAEETFPCLVEENRLTITAYGTDWVFERATEENQPRIRKDIIRSDQMAVELSEETVQELEALLRAGIGKPVSNIIFKHEYWYNIPALQDAFDSELVSVSDYGTFHYGNKAYYLTNWEEIEDFLGTLYRVKY